MIEFFFVAFASLFTVVNPLGVLPVFISLTNDLKDKAKQRTAFRAVLTAILVMLFFTFSGSYLFTFFGISIHGLRVVGGIIFLILGFDMLNARFLRIKEEDETEAEYSNDISITPLGVPMICGPGAITASIVMMSDTKSLWDVSGLVIAIVAVMFITYLTLLSSHRIIAFMGTNGTKVLTRIMGLIVMVIAIEYLKNGLTPIVREMLQLH